jgi:hypothetical protein
VAQRSLLPPPCPCNLVDERAQDLLCGVVAAHPVAVDAQCESGVGVPELVHDAARIDAASTSPRTMGELPSLRRPWRPSPGG